MAKMDSNKIFTSEEGREDGAERNGNKEHDRKRNVRDLIGISSTRKVALNSVL